MEVYLKAFPIEGWKPFFSDKNVIELINKVEENISKVTKEENVTPGVDVRFSAFRVTPLEKVKVVIIGMDPYYTRGVATGLSFSTWKKIQPSLENIFKHMEKTVKHFKSPKTGNLLHWASQGVFLINAALTTEVGKSGAHSSIWKPFTSYLLNYLSQNKKGLIFVLWGGEAQKLSKVISNKHTILTCNHPSPMSVNRYTPEESPDHFFNNNHFNEINNILFDSGSNQIQWCFPDTIIDADCNIMFFDIETTGFSKDMHHITTIVWLYRGELKTWVHGEDKSEFIADWNMCDEIVTYNGTRFDVPFVMQHFGLEDKEKHCDLLKYYKNHFGGLKSTCKAIGAYRPSHIGDIDGQQCPYLWKEYINGNIQSLDKLKFYNAWDVIDTYRLYCHLHGIQHRDFTNQIKPIPNQ